jgi:hypothetical protein
MGKRRRKLKSHDVPAEQVDHFPAVPEIATPPGVRTIRLNRICQNPDCPNGSIVQTRDGEKRIGGRWDVKARWEVDGEQVPARHRCYLVQDILWPELTRTDEGWDLWPVVPDVLGMTWARRRGRLVLIDGNGQPGHWSDQKADKCEPGIWLCQDCYAAAEAIGIRQWAWNWRWERGLAEVCQEERDAAEQSPSAQAIHVAVNAYAVEPSGEVVGLRIPECELPTENPNRLAIMARWMAYSLSNQ